MAVTGAWKEDGELRFADFQLVHSAPRASLAKVAVRAVRPYVMHLRTINDFWICFSLLTLLQVKKKKRWDQVENERSSHEFPTYNKDEVLGKGAETAGQCSVSGACKYYKFLTQFPKQSSLQWC